MFTKIHEIIQKGQFTGCEITTKINSTNMVAIVTFLQPLSNDMTLFNNEDKKQKNDKTQDILNLRAALALPIVVSVSDVDTLETAITDKLIGLESTLVDGNSHLVGLDVEASIKGALAATQATTNQAGNAEPTPPAAADESQDENNDDDLFSEITSL